MKEVRMKRGERIAVVPLKVLLLHHPLVSLVVGKGNKHLRLFIAVFFKVLNLLSLRTSVVRPALVHFTWSMYIKLLTVGILQHEINLLVMIADFVTCSN